MTDCHRLKLPAADGKSYLTDVATAETLLRLVQVDPQPQGRTHQTLASQSGLRTHAGAELIFTALAELSTRKIAETKNETGMDENKVAAKSGGKIAKDARVALEDQTRGKVVNSGNYLISPAKGIRGKN